MREAKLGEKNPMFGRHWTEEAKAKLKLSRSWYRHSPETREKISQARIRYYKEHPEAIEQVKGRNNPMFGRNGALNPMFGKHLSYEAKKKLSTGRIGRYTGAANPFYGRRHSEKTRNKMKEKWVNRMFPEKDSKLELKLQQALTEKHVSFEKQARVPGRPDIFMQPNICVFIDGCYWHGCPCKFNQNWTNPHAVYIKSRIVHDAKINAELGRAGFVVLRLKEHEINQDIGSCVSRILEKTTWKAKA